MINIRQNAFASLGRLKEIRGHSTSQASYVNKVKREWEHLQLGRSQDDTAQLIHAQVEKLSAKADGPSEVARLRRMGIGAAALAIGGPVGVGLQAAEGSEELRNSVIRDLTSTIGRYQEEATPLVEGLTPSGLGFGAEATYGEWRLGQSLAFVTEGTPELLKESLAVHGHLTGEKLDGTYFRNFQNRRSDHLKAHRDWHDPGLSSLKIGGEVAFLAPTGGSWSTMRGVVSESAGAGFRLEGSDQRFSQNKVQGLRTAPEPAEPEPDRGILKRIFRRS